MRTSKQWFTVDAHGMAQVLARRGKAFILYELISNALDAPGTTSVAVEVRRKGGTDLAEVVVEDNSPRGFTDLAAGYTLFMPSERKALAERRGRFGVGDKVALAQFVRVQITSTTGTVRFDERGRTRTSQARAAGSRIRGEIALSDEEIVDVEQAVRRILVPRGVSLLLNGREVPYREPLKTIHVTLPTELDDGSGKLRPTRRKTAVHIHAARAGEPTMIHELGIPIVAVGDPFNIDVMQKVPLGIDRDSLTPAYLGQLRAAVLEAMAETLSSEEANAPWVRDAFHRYGHALPAATVQRVLDLRFSDKRVAYDPSDREANARAVAAGYTVVYGSQMSAAEWDAARRANAIQPAGLVTPSPRPDTDPDGRAREYLDRAKWSPAIREVCALAERIGSRLIGRPITVEVACDITWPFAATFGGSRLTFNLGRLSHGFFEGPLAPILGLILHECAHSFESNHLSERYYDALSALGGKLAVLALEEPALFHMACDSRSTLGAA